MTEFKLVAVEDKSNYKNVVVPSDLIVCKQLDTPHLAKNVKRCTALLEFLTKVGINRLNDGALSYEGKRYGHIKYDDVIYYLVDGGRKRTPDGLNEVIEFLKREKVPKKMVSRQFHNRLSL